MKKSGKKKPKPMDLPNPLQVDAEEFTDVIDKMIQTPPAPLKEIRKRRKNPERDPRYLPVFDFSRKVRVEHKKKSEG